MIANGVVDPHHPWQVVHQGYTVLVTNRDGSLSARGREGLFDFDTRILSVHRLTLDGRVPESVSTGTPESDRWTARLRVRRPGGDAEGPALPEDALELMLERRVGRGMEERHCVRNHGMSPVETELTIELDADFADVQEVGRERRQTGDVDVAWDAPTRTLRFDYGVERHGRSLHRALRVCVVECDSEPIVTGRVLRFPIRLAPKGEWRAVVSHASLVDGEWRDPLAPPPAAPDGAAPDGAAPDGAAPDGAAPDGAAPDGAAPDGAAPDGAAPDGAGPDGAAPGGAGPTASERDRIRDRWRRERARLETAERVVGPAFERAAEDLFALRRWEHDEALDAWHTVAGVPTYTGLFGRDSLTAAWQGALIGPEMLRGALAATASTQATADDAFRDEEPGKLIHEMRRGPLSELDIIPQRRYYGTQTTPAMFVLALSEYWHWTGDESLLRRYRDVALRTFDWAAQHGDRDGDGLLEYVRRSPAGLKNQGWKDSDEAIRYPDGLMVPNPIATIEEQAYHFIALQRMAELLLVLGEEARAETFVESARSLQHRVNEAFWIEEDGFYAMALDPAKRPVRSIGSNPGHALATGIVPESRARATADRLLAPDLFSGWGVRTLSTEHPSYNPWGYHLGTVWPVENATFALGMKRYGLDEHAERIVAGMFDACAGFHAQRLPEALSGHARDESPIPCAYPGSNSPQAWSASATVQFVQIMLGLYPFAPANVVALVRPRLPAGLDAVTLHHLRVGDATATIRFERGADGSAHHDVIRKQGRLHVITIPPPQNIGAGGVSWTDRIKEWMLEHAPGRTAAALRIAMGEPG